MALHPPGAGPVRIRSAHDAFVAFPPGTEHRVEPVRCDPGDWRAGRFSIRGFVSVEMLLDVLLLDEPE